MIKKIVSTVIRLPFRALKKILRVLGRVMSFAGLGGLAHGIGLVSDRDFSGNYAGDSGGVLGLAGRVVAAPVKIPTTTVSKASNKLDGLGKKLLRKMRQ